MTIIEWATLGALLIALFIFCARLMRRGLSSLDDTRKKHLEKIDGEKQHLAEDAKNISAYDHLYVLHAALADLIRLSENPVAWQMHRHNNVITLKSPSAYWEIELVMRERALSSTRRILHGKPDWILRSKDSQEHFPEIGKMMKVLNEHIRSRAQSECLPPCITRRLEGTRSNIHPLRAHCASQKNWKY